MLRRTRVAAIAAVATALLLSGCSCTDFGIYHREGQGIIATSTKALDEALATATALADRAAALPADLPGAADLKAKLAAQKAALAALKGRFDGYHPGIDAAAKADDAGKAVELLAQLKGVAGQVAGAGAGLPALAAELGKLEEAARAAAPKVYTRALSTGYTLTGNLSGIEAQLVAFIEDASRPVDKSTWFDFDRLLFRTGSAELDTARSAEQLKNVAEILKAFPKVTVKVGGYTDNVGQPAANLKLSTARAQNVARSLTALGVAATRLDPEGYGQEHPVCPANDTEACKAQNRRISLRVTAK